MQYSGGKSRIAIPIAEIINNRIQKSGGGFVSLFCGACSVEKLIDAPYRICNDKHPYLIELWRALQRGWIPPEEVDEALYREVRDNKDIDMALTGFVGFGCSFGGKWFEGYARNKRGDNYAARASKSLLRDVALLKDAEFVCGDYRALTIPEGAVVYADPPYAGTTGYGERFDSDAFWDFVRGLSKTHAVYISEENAPDDFEAVWEQPLKRTLDANKENNFTRLERLWVWKG